jgi:2,4'-dihydroxyacetophenone dioxygenase
MVPPALPQPVAGYWMNVLKVRKSGVLSRHRHPQAVHGLVLKGRWRYLEHDWVAEEGAYVSSRQGRLTRSSSPTMSRR